MVAAIPSEIGSDFAGCPPGHRFRIYWDGWDEWFRPTTHDAERAMSRVVAPSREASESVKALRARRSALVASDSQVSRVERTTSAPLVTGMGIEHPIENGFAFLDPHGVPYLAGSTVKGTLRRAAEELAAEAHSGSWSLSDVWFLFGFDATSPLDGLGEALERGEEEDFQWLRPIVARHIGKRSFETFIRDLASRPQKSDTELLRYRGALSCWDALIDTPCGALRVDIMNPHHGGYYTGDQPPSDEQSPVPIKFVCVPPGASVDLCFRFEPCLPAGSPGANEWRSRLEAALAHAGEWLGFGAKTSVGYGRFEVAASAGATPEQQASSTLRAPREETWTNCTLTFQPNDGSLTAQGSDDRAEARGDDALRLRRSLPDALQDRLKKKKRLVGVTVHVRVEGNMRTIVGIEVSS